MDDAARKKDLAEKLLTTERLTRAERQEIYEFLTGMKVQKPKRGPRHKTDRDKRLALVDAGS